MISGATITQGYAEVVSDSGHQGDGMSAAFALNDTFAAQQFGSSPCQPSRQQPSKL